jgi:hypothetical protein
LRIVRPGTALTAGILIVIMMAVSAAVNAAGHALKLSTLGEAALWLSFGLVGVVVAWHQPRNPMGWVLLGVTFFFTLDATASGYTVLDYRQHGGRLPLGWLAVLLSPSWAPAIVLAGLAVLLFPDGRFPSGRWRPVTWAYLAIGAIWLVSAFAISLDDVLSHAVRIDSSGGLSSLDDPRGSTAWFEAVQNVFFPGVAASWLAWLAGKVMTYRRSVGERRLQLKWLISGAAVFIVAGITLVILNSPAGWLSVVDVAAAIGTLALPVSIGFGILKFRLYDIDRIISRTLGYTIVTGLLVGVYAGMVLLATQVLHHPGPVTVATSTLVVAALFNPLRHRVQRAVDRRFNRARYDADRTVAAFAVRLQDHVELGAVRADLLDVVRDVLEPTHVALSVIEVKLLACNSLGS